ncbi:DegT/DnrJ/EryC1/StrS family aminotransferase [Saccharothrix longispora]|uniref:dTDP-4-amino-4,6-dideoxygalactose transaminase n=1 Tax=Saccharothrix longispora TaxID=33920 RepID=A0ABU1PUP3_9PSEU|nr:DegT/DnrJ/EryC1/StrS family aminotransferase [Saccharothrix longispora]MDR6593998.1 dTDP-4-amino-4,6-dideoxygalactose transaminase [Saccharothrix longispora]
MTGALAMFGGGRVIERGSVPAEQVRWPVVTEAEHEAARRVFDSGVFTSNTTGGGEVASLEREWAEFVGAPHCAAVSNGTAAIELALAAAGVEPGAEILVPALTFIASAVAAVQRMLVPVFVDVDPVTYTMSPTEAERLVTPRTRAILAVHLHGLPADMTALRALADRHGLLLVEDAAQSHGATYRGRRTGTLGDVATFSLNVVKNLPTCGEGGLITTADAELHRKVVLHRQFGEDLTRRERDYVSRVLAGNAKLSAVQAAFARSQLARLAEYDEARQRNVGALLARLADLPGLVPPVVPEDRTHAWHILRFRFDPVAMGCADVDPGALRTVLQRALRAEGVPVQQYQQVPLPWQEAFRTGAGFGGYPWALRGEAPAEPRVEDFPVSTAVVEDSLTLQRWHLNPDSGPVLLRCAEAFHKVWDNLDTLVPIARAVEHRPPWTRYANTRTEA